MATKEEWDFGQRRLQKSREKITAILNTWDYETNGEPTPKKLSKLIPMSIKAVRRHYPDFIRKINQINQIEQNRLNENQINIDQMKKEFQESINDNDDKDEKTNHSPILARRALDAEKSEFEIELKKLFLENGYKNYVHANELEYGFCYDIESNDFLNYDYKQIIEHKTEKAFLIDVNNIDYFNDLNLQNYCDINPKRWFPKSKTIYNDEHILWVDEWIIKKIYSSIEDEINNL